MKSDVEMERIMNLTYPGLRLLHRDTNARKLAGRYEVGKLLRDERAVQGSFIGGGPLGASRYAILSNRIEEAQPGTFGAEWAMGTIAAGAHFKVLDVYRRLGNVQIALLHLPEAHWQFFDDVSTNVDDLLVEYVRRRFDGCLDAEPVQALADEQWRKICVHLVGMTDLGVPFPLA